jgi:DNA-binding LytR/AlgR family response regulator
VSGGHTAAIGPRRWAAPTPHEEGLVLLAADDERPALEDLARLLRASPLVAEVEALDGARDVLVAVSRRPYDGLLLDVRMPGMDGVGLARLIARFAAPPPVVFVSAYETAAVEAFEVRALDYLMKPVSRARLDEALERIAAVRPERSAGGDELDLVAVHNPRGGGTRLLAHASILYVQAHGDYVRVVSDEGRFLLRASLAEVEARWEALGFVRVHRAYVVNLRRAVEVRPSVNGTAVLVLGEGAQVPIARRQVRELRERLRL